MAQGARYGLEAYNDWQARPKEEEPKEGEKEGGGEEGGGKKSAASAAGKKKKENFFDQFGFGGPSKFYEGGFDDTMSRKEAALILGVRESASVKRIKDAHRGILIANHPDTGGSTFIASKVNEAKELLIKGKDKK